MALVALVLLRNCTPLESRVALYIFKQPVMYITLFDAVNLHAIVFSCRVLLRMSKAGNFCWLVLFRSGKVIRETAFSSAPSFGFVKWSFVWCRLNNSRQGVGNADIEAFNQYWTAHSQIQRNSTEHRDELSV